MGKAPNTKTPDFLLYESLNIGACPVMWIESKSVFADEMEHNRYQKKQLSYYEDLYGAGLVVYWYGFIDTIVPKDYMIMDYIFFEEMGYKLDRLMDQTIG